MKRLSRKARKQKKQEEQCREKKLSKAGIPYSKHKKRICYHFGWSGDMALGVRIYAMTEKDNDNRYVCRGCGKVFTQAEMKQMEKLCFYLQATPVKSKSKVQDLLKGIEPVEYYYKDRNEIVRCSRLDVLPRIVGVWNE
ncbi:hypothetical protein [Roseburia sp.]|uniref:hypothetical protein n=1 Tax=Roseburia sp. TaxID=2049040 RepID=UPI003522DCF6